MTERAVDVMCTEAHSVFSASCNKMPHGPHPLRTHLSVAEAEAGQQQSQHHLGQLHQVLTHLTAAVCPHRPHQRHESLQQLHM